MARYINEDEFVAWVKEHWCADCQNDNGLRCRACWIDDAIDIVEEAPAADVAPKSEVAREIFEEIIRPIYYKIPPKIRPILRSDGRDFDDGYRDDKTDAFIEVLMLIADLEKKYTEDKE